MCLGFPPHTEPGDVSARRSLPFDLEVKQSGHGPPLTEPHLDSLCSCHPANPQTQMKTSCLPGFTLMRVCNGASATVVSVACGMRHCAVLTGEPQMRGFPRGRALTHLFKHLATAGGIIHTWGSNLQRQLGASSPNLLHAQHPLTVALPATTARGVTCGDYHTVATMGE